jgi:hypothetical protein
MLLISRSFEIMSHLLRPRASHRLSRSIAHYVPNDDATVRFPFFNLDNVEAVASAIASALPGCGSVGIRQRVCSPWQGRVCSRVLPH